MAQAKKAETTENTPVEEKAEAQAKETKAKIYHFTSRNKYLTCSGLGIQFLDGKASTKSVEVAKALVKIDGVELVEE